MNSGYVRESGDNQNLLIQIEALKNYGCEKIFHDRQGSFNDRPALTKMKSELRRGDRVVVWKLDRIGKSLYDLITLIDSFKDQGIDFVSLQENVDTGTVRGRIFIEMMTSLQEFETGIIRERTIAGLEHARKRGRKGGRPAGLSANAIRIAREANRLYNDDDIKVEDIARTLGIGKTTLYRYLHYSGTDIVHKRARGIKISDGMVYKEKIRKELFKKLLRVKAFWSHPNVKYENISDDILIQKVLEELDLVDIKKLFSLFGKNHIKKVWKNEIIIQDPHYRSLNLLLAKLFFDINKPEQYIRKVQMDFQKSNNL